MYCAYRRATFSIFPFKFRFWVRVEGGDLVCARRCYNNTMLFRSYCIQILLIENGQSYRNSGSLFNREFKRYFRCSTPFRVGLFFFFQVYSTKLGTEIFPWLIIAWLNAIIFYCGNPIFIVLWKDEWKMAKSKARSDSKYGFF